MNIRRVVHISNAPTPYRVDFFNAFHRLAGEKIEFHAIYYSSRESNRLWEVDSSKIDFPVSIYKSREINIGSIRTYLNFQIFWKSILIRPTVLVFAGAWHYPPSIFVAVIARMLGIKVFFWSEENDFTKRPSPFMAYVKRCVYSLYGSFLVPNARTVSELESYLKTFDFRTIRNSIDTNFFCRPDSSRGRFGLFTADRHVKFVSVCELSVRKGVDQLVGIFKKLQQEYQDRGISISLYLIGAGPLENDIRVISKGCDFIHVFGNLDKCGVKRHLVNSDVFVLNSLSDPNPLSVIEAIACGCLPLLSSAVGNCFEFLPKDSSLVFKVGNIESGIRNVLEMSEDFYLNQMNSLKEIIPLYDVETVAKDLFEIVDASSA